MLTSDHLSVLVGDSTPVLLGFFCWVTLAGYLCFHCVEFRGFRNYGLLSLLKTANALLFYVGLK